MHRQLPIPTPSIPEHFFDALRRANNVARERLLYVLVPKDPNYQGRLRDLPRDQLRYTIRSAKASPHHACPSPHSEYIPSRLHYERLAELNYVRRRHVPPPLLR